MRELPLPKELLPRELLERVVLPPNELLLERFPNEERLSVDCLFEAPVLGVKERVGVELTFPFELDLSLSLNDDETLSFLAPL